jgi:hypothetical protein
MLGYYREKRTDTINLSAKNGVFPVENKIILKINYLPTKNRAIFVVVQE